MKLSDETRKRAVQAFKQELLGAIVVLRMDLAADSSAWKGKEHKMLLHRLKGGAGFLEYEHLKIQLADLEKQALEYPANPQAWLIIMAEWERLIERLN